MSKLGWGSKKVRHTSCSRGTISGEVQAPGRVTLAIAMDSGADTFVVLNAADPDGGDAGWGVL